MASEVGLLVVVVFGFGILGFEFDENKEGFDDFLKRFERRARVPCCLALEQNIR